MNTSKRRILAFILVLGLLAAPVMPAVSANAMEPENFEEGSVEILSQETQEATDIESDTVLKEAPGSTDTLEEGKTSESTDVSGDEEVPEKDLDATDVQSEDDAEEEKDPEVEEDTVKTLSIVNNVAMFKVISAEVIPGETGDVLRFVLSGSGYREMYPGTPKAAIENGLNKEAFIHGYLNDQGKYTFDLPIAKGTSSIPISAISQKYLDKAESGEGEFADAVFGRLFTINYESLTLTVDNYVEPEVPAETVKTLSIVNNVAMFKVISAEVITGEKGDVLRFALNGSGYREIYPGTPSAAIENGLNKDAFIHGYLNDQGKYTFDLPIAKGAASVPFSAISQKYLDKAESGEGEFAEAVFGRLFTIDYDSLTLTVDKYEEPEVPVEPEPEKPGESGEEKDPSEDDSDKGYVSEGASTSRVDTSTTLPDGTYVPGSFSFAGGTGRLLITCSKIAVIGGKSFATINFSKTSGGASSVDRVKAGGQEFYGFNSFVIPVKLNANNQIIIRTTAMSQPHWISYTIFVGMEEPGEGLLANTETFDEIAPEIPGLKSLGEVELEHTKYAKLFRYEEDCYLLEVDVISDTEREKTHLEETELYKRNILKYLIVPQGKEIPAGLEDKVIVITAKPESAAVCSEELLKYFEEKELTVDTEFLELESGNWDYKALLEKDVELVIETSGILKGEDETPKLYELSEKADQLEIPVLVDRSGDETDEKAREDWDVIYELILTGTLKEDR